MKHWFYVLDNKREIMWTSGLDFFIKNKYDEMHRTCFYVFCKKK